ncbi:MAG: PIN domain nuclease [Acidobacteria bacterium]|nr:PIN domain nuclease [Acidobacteriota bacterium]MBV9146076.1 PIN domain nuclease [Acidobacteriota bacterium]MBV9435021.1 PIN domain nuclease [Acidobacteriota bacterium]
MILVDSSVWADFFNASPGPAGRELRRLIATSENLAFTGLTVTEVLQGLTRNIDQVDSFLSKWKVLEPLDRGTYVHAAAIFRLARSQGIRVATIDAIIAAVALEQSASVFSLDKDFQRIAVLTGLSLHPTS